MKAVISGVMQLLMLSLISYLLFMKLPNIWLIELAAIEIITVICLAEEYEEHNVMVLRPIHLDETCVLIVEKSADTDLWHDVENDAVRSEILQKYMENNRPDCMEAIE